MINLVPDAILQVIEKGGPEAQNLSKDMCEGIYYEMIGGGRVAMEELRDLKAGAIKIVGPGEPVDSNGENINVVTVEPISVHKGVAHMNPDDVWVHYSFDGPLDHFVRNVRNLEHLIQQRRIYVVPEALAWSADGSHPDGPEASGRIRFVHESRLILKAEIQNRDHWDYARTRFMS
jgi:hypothetical protein